MRIADDVRSALLAALGTDGMAGRMRADHGKERELEVVRGWKEDSSLPVPVRRFAEDAE